MLLFDLKPVLFVMAVLFVVTGLNPAHKFDARPRLRD